MVGPGGRGLPAGGLGGGAPQALPLALVAGGVGVAPLLALADTLDVAFDFYAGFRETPLALPWPAVVVSGGLITDVFDPAPYAVVYACGPAPMLKTVAARCAASGTPCFVSLERRMACGVGACLGCSVNTVHGPRRCCVDGPVFDARDVIFDD